MQIILPGQFSEHRDFISEELPSLVYQANMDSKVGGKLVRTTLKTDRLQNWNVLDDSPSCFEASVFLGKSSNSLLAGRRRIVVRAEQQQEQVVIELMSSNKAMTGVVIGLVCCFVPGVLLFVIKTMHDGFERRIMSKVAGEVKRRYSDAVVQP